MLDVKQNHLDSIKQILKKHIPQNSVWAFGSRVTGKASKHSDLDLVIINDKKISTNTLAMLEYDFESSEIPFRIDLIEWSQTDNSFKKVILANYVNIFEIAE